MYQCMECDHLFRSVAAAERATDNGCPKCGGFDIDVYVRPSWPTQMTEKPPLHKGELSRERCRGTVVTH